jgi:DNA-binding response OmpR family regulator
VAKTILLIEDEVRFLEGLELYLKEAGYEILKATRGLEGLHKAIEMGPDLVILDIMMPDIDGYEVCRRLRADPETEDLPVLMLTAKSQVADKVTGFKSGADDYMTKPVHLAELGARVEALLKRTVKPAAPDVAAPVSGRVIGFLGAKGGVGTSMVAANVGVALSQKEHSVLLIDLRPFFGTTSLQLNLTPRNTITDLLDLDPSRVNTEEMTKCLIPYRNGLNVLASAREPRKHIHIPPPHVKAILHVSKSMANYVLIDLPPHPSAANREALMHCDFIVLVTEPEPLAVACAKSTLTWLEALGILENRVGIVVVNRTRSAMNIPIPKMLSFLNRGFLGTFPPDPEACFDAEKQGTPIILTRPQSMIASSMRELADHLSAEDIILKKEL